MSSVSFSLRSPVEAAQPSAESAFSQSNLNSLALKTVASGAAVCYLFGAPIALYAVVANVALSILSKQASHEPWAARERCIENLQAGVKWWPLFLVTNVIAGVIIWMRGPLVNQAAISLIREGLASFQKLARIIFRVTIVAPVIEEVIFRGFLQEKIRDIQVICFGSNADSPMQSTARVILQAAVFSVCHYDVLQGASNIPILLGTFGAGFCMGEYKEMYHSLLPSMSLHWMINSVVATRVLLVGG